MKTFVTVIQIGSNKFDVFKFNATSSTRVNTGNEYKGALITVWESSKQNDQYCFNLAEQMMNAFNK